ncbi:phosphopantetheine-binding protein, partial [Pseudoalteromonas sp.]|uniref:phosphopantetheine-binding protein n=1 Tax=Pseudoalteromonas sp. TaxID=53249 RepID=UPI002356EA49
MIPSRFILLSQWPQTANGKIDRKALPVSEEVDISGEYVAPTSELERILVEIWSEILDIPITQISTNANFFELGGHSLLIMKLITNLNKLGYECQAQAIFKAINLQAMGRHLESSTKSQCEFIVPDYVIPKNVARITSDMLPLIELEQNKLDEIMEKVSGGIANVQDIYPLAPLQEGVLFIHTMNEQHDPYISTMAFELSNEQLVKKLCENLNFMIERHDVLRTAILWRGRQQALQLVQRHAQLPVIKLDLRGPDL